LSRSRFADGKTLASGRRDGTVRLWEVATGKEIRNLKGHQGWVIPLLFLRWARPWLREAAIERLWCGRLLNLDTTRATHTRAVVGMLEPTWPARMCRRRIKRLGRWLDRPGKPCHFWKERVRSVPPVNPQQLATLISGLDSNQFKVREKSPPGAGDTRRGCRFDSETETGRQATAGDAPAESRTCWKSSTGQTVSGTIEALRAVQCWNKSALQKRGNCLPI